MREIISSMALIVAMLTGVGCMAFTRSLQSPFFARFSLQKLVEKNKYYYMLDCSTRSGGGGGGGIGTGVGGGNLSRNKFHLQRGDSFSCKLSDRAGQFDETGFTDALKQDVEKEIGESGAKMTASGDSDAGGFYFEYELKDARGRVEVSGKKSRDSYYHLQAHLDERSKEENQ